MHDQLVPVTTDADRAALDALWGASQAADDRGFRPQGGWWSLARWAATSVLLRAGSTPIGALALNWAPDGAAEARLALLPGRRTSEAAHVLVRSALEQAGIMGAATARLTLPGAAAWARSAAAEQGFAVARATLVMRRPATLGPLPTRAVPGVRIRPLAAGEEGRVLHALNHAWVGTWNFRPLTRQALARDLSASRAGFLLAVDDQERIVGTVHAQFDRDGQNLDGGPFAWLANLTTDPAWRGKGLGRVLLAAGSAWLHAQGASSVMLGVDAGAPAPLALYRSAGFGDVDSLELWERALPVSAPDRGTALAACGLSSTSTAAPAPTPHG